MSINFNRKNIYIGINGSLRLPSKFCFIKLSLKVLKFLPENKYRFNLYSFAVLLLLI